MRFKMPTSDRKVEIFCFSGKKYQPTEVPGCELGDFTRARRLVELYLSGSLTWEQAATAANHIYLLMVRECGDRVPDYAWDVYLAFDAGECIAPGGDATTRPLIEQIVTRYATV
jgi:hypothetical protein